MISFFCRTPIHVFRTIQLKIQQYPNVATDVYIFDSFNNAETICNRMKKTGIFDNVYYVKDNEYIKTGKLHVLKTVLGRSEFKSILSTKKYAQIFVFNIYGIFNDIIYNTQIRRNPQLVFNMIEDGPSTYHIEEIKGKVQRYLYPILRKKVPIECIDYWWFSRPDLMCPLSVGEKKQLPLVDKSNSQLLDTINSVFDFKCPEILDDAQILIMEECFWNDHLLKESKDLELFCRIKEAFPDIQICAKLHPRTRTDRFSEYFAMCPNDGVPWEVYALNMDMHSKILVSLSCATMISSKLLFNEEPHSLLLYPILMEDIIDNRTMKPYLTEERQRIINNQKLLYANPEKFQVVSSLEQGIEIIRNWLENIEENV